MTIYCPVPDAEVECPYYTRGGRCRLRNPREECDDYYAYVGDEEEEER